MVNRATYRFSSRPPYIGSITDVADLYCAVWVQFHLNGWSRVLEDHGSIRSEPLHDETHVLARVSEHQHQFPLTISDSFQKRSPPSKQIQGPGVAPQADVVPYVW